MLEPWILDSEHSRRLSSSNRLLYCSEDKATARLTAPGGLHRKGEPWRAGGSPVGVVSIRHSSLPGLLLAGWQRHLPVCYRSKESFGKIGCAENLVGLLQVVSHRVRR